MSSVSEHDVHQVVAQANAVGLDPAKLIALIQDLGALWGDAAFRKFLADLALLFGLNIPFQPTPNPTPNPAPNPTP